MENLCAMSIMHVRRCAARGFLSLSWITISLLARSVIAGISGDMENDSPSRAMMDDEKRNYIADQNGFSSKVSLTSTVSQLKN